MVYLCCPRGTQLPKPRENTSLSVKGQITQTVMEAKTMSKFDFVTSIEDVKSVTDPLVRVVTRMEIALREQEESFLLKVEELETKVDELQTKVEDLESHVSEVAESDKELMTETVQELLSGGTFTFDY